MTVLRNLVLKLFSIEELSIMSLTSRIEALEASMTQAQADVAALKAAGTAAAPDLTPITTELATLTQGLSDLKAYVGEPSTPAA